MLGIGPWTFIYIAEWAGAEEAGTEGTKEGEIVVNGDV